MIDFKIATTPEEFIKIWNELTENRQPIARIDFRPGSPTYLEGWYIFYFLEKLPPQGFAMPRRG
jgi:hypothetical protein